MASVNIFVPLLAANKSDGPVRNRSVIFVSARMDAASMFDDLSVGADTAITGLISLVAVAEMLNKVKNDLNTTEVSNVFLVLFNGEAYDYIGSSRMAYDMKTGVDFHESTLSFIYLYVFLLCGLCRQFPEIAA